MASDATTDPRGAPLSAGKPSITREAGPPPRPKSELRILVAEDNPINQQVALLMLQKLGYPADAVSNGLQAVEAIAHTTYNLILMDCEMPEMDGYKATFEIRRLESEGTHIPVVAMTANTNTGDRARCLAAGMDDYIPKPVKEQKLREALEAWLYPSKLPGNGT